MDCFGIRLVGINAENGQKLLLAIGFVAGVLLLRSGLARLLRLVMRGRGGQVRFWARQLLSLASAVLVLLGFPPSSTGGDLQAANGTFQSAEGRAMTFSTAATTTIGRAGLYRGTGATGNTSLTMGVIVHPDGGLRGVLRAGQSLRPVADPAFAAKGLVATFAEFGPVTAQRLGT